MLDILLLLIPYLPILQLDEVIKMILQRKVFEHQDGSIQKLGYRLLGRAVMERAERSLDGMGDTDGANEVGRMAEKVTADVGTSEDIHIGAVKVSNFIGYTLYAICLTINHQSRNA